MFRLLKRILRKQKPYVSKWHKRQTEISSLSVSVLSVQTSVFTIGSCFASNLAAYMGEFGIKGATHPGRPFYHTKAILQEIEKLVCGSKNQQQVQAWETAKGFQSPYMNHLEYEGFENLDALFAWTNEINSVAYDRLHQADVVVITLGLIEAWYHSSSNTYFKQCPPATELSRLEPKFRRLSVRDMYDDLTAIRKLICDVLGAELIITVSPVPLISTFMPLDVQVANSESKSRIRAAVSEFIEAHPEVHYFPAYEIVSAGERMNDFMLKDGRHLHADAIRYVISQFINCFSHHRFSINPAKKLWLTHIEKNYPAPAVVKGFPKDRANELAEILVASSEKVFVYGDDEWSIDFLYTSGILNANFVGFVSEDNRRPFCGQNCWFLNDLKKQRSAWVVVAQQDFQPGVLHKLKEIFPSDKVVLLHIGQ